MSWIQFLHKVHTRIFFFRHHISQFDIFFASLFKFGPFLTKYLQVTSNFLQSMHMRLL